ncbi:MAG: ABC transporter substrate-binding protein, partial [Coriobacteriia bacterium]
EKMKRFLIVLFSLLIVATMVLTACAPTAEEPVATEEAPAEEVAATEAPAEEVAPTEAPATEEVAPTEAPVVEEGPKVGGTYVLTSQEQPDTLDIQKSGFAITSGVLGWLGGSLLAKDMEGNYIPYLAESWDISEDGLTYTFHLRDDVKFHNGDPLTAHDWVYTFDRATADDFVSPVTADQLAAMSGWEAVDDYTLVITLDQPFFAILNTFTYGDYLAPYSQRAVEEAGEDYGWSSVVSVGPYKFVEWVSDEKIVLTRNEDYTWGYEPYEGANTGAYYLENVEYRILPDYTTQLAAFQAGEITAFGIQSKDLPEFEGNPNFQLLTDLNTGFYYITWNEEQWPFDDVLVRQAFSLAVDKQTIVDVVANGYGVPVDGPLSPSMIGYCPETEGTGYKYDLEAAKTKLEEAGFVMNDATGIYEKDGKPLAFTFKSLTPETYAKYSQILIEMWREMGADVAIEQFDWPTASPQYTDGDFVMGTLHIGWPEADILYMMFHSTSIGGLNFTRVASPELDALLESTRTSTDPAERQQAVCDTVAWLIDDASVLPLYAGQWFTALQSNLVGSSYSPFTGLNLMDAYFNDLP